MNNIYIYIYVYIYIYNVYILFILVKVSSIDQHLQTDLYCKPTDCHQFLDFNFAHPIYIKKSIVFGQSLSIKRLCSSNVAFENCLEILKGWFQNRGYPRKMVENQLKRVIETRQKSDRTYKRSNGVLLVLIYHPRLKNVNDIMKKHLVLLYVKEKVENIFTPSHFDSFLLVLESIWLELKCILFYVIIWL